MHIPLMWVEARCDWTDEPATDKYGSSMCHETAPGGFYSSIHRAVADTKKCGWRIIKNRWICPACRKAQKL